jgi:hypothetical protein
MRVYGGSPALRGWLEDRGVWHVLAVKCTEPLDVCSPNGVRTSAEQRAAAVPAEQWIACSAGYGAKGRRLDNWTRLQLASPATSGMAPGGCWCAAAAATASWPSTPATAQPRR